MKFDDVVKDYCINLCADSFNRNRDYYKDKDVWYKLVEVSGMGIEELGKYLDREYSSMLSKVNFDKDITNIVREREIYNESGYDGLVDKFDRVHDIVDVIGNNVKIDKYYNEMEYNESNGYFNDRRFTIGMNNSIYSALSLCDKLDWDEKKEEFKKIWGVALEVCIERGIEGYEGDYERYRDNFRSDVKYADSREELLKYVQYFKSLNEAFIGGLAEKNYKEAKITLSKYNEYMKTENIESLSCKKIFRNTKKDIDELRRIFKDYDIIQTVQYWDKNNILFGKKENLYNEKTKKEANIYQDAKIGTRYLMDKDFNQKSIEYFISEYKKSLESDKVKHLKENKTENKEKKTSKARRG